MHSIHDFVFQSIFMKKKLMFIFKIVFELSFNLNSKDKRRESCLNCYQLIPTDLLFSSFFIAIFFLFFVENVSKNLIKANDHCLRIFRSGKRLSDISWVKRGYDHNMTLIWMLCIHSEAILIALSTRSAILSPHWTHLWAKSGLMSNKWIAIQS